ncbi:MAG: hypothetical protein L3J73_02430 [Thermoplasmata archaeon]|nr:hypothetical protein [Thermoplasmata archaeon]
MVLLNPGETVVKEANVVRLNPQGARPGVLTLTTHRLVFEAHVPAGPMGGPIVRTTIDAPLGRIRNAGAPGGSRLQIELPMQVGIFQTPEAEAWVQAITEARSRAPPGMGGMGGMGGPGGRGGPGGPGMPPAVVLRCRYCGLLNQPTVTKCTGCGAPI